MRLFSAPRLGLLEAIAFAVHLEDMDMMGEAIGPRAGQTLVAEHGSMTPILGWVGCLITVTDSRRSLFGQQFAVLSERSGRGPAFVVVELPDGRRRSIRIGRAAHSRVRRR
jgi:hypothetical protein